MKDKKYKSDEVFEAAAFDVKRTYFSSGVTRTYSFRLFQLKKLKKTIKEFEVGIFEALSADLVKPNFEAYVSEIGLLYNEINYAIRRLRRWMKPRWKYTPIVHFPSISRIVSEPHGIVLIISPWNFPFQLMLTPLVGAIAAGNCAVLKPSRETPHTAAIIEKIIKAAFDKQYISVVPGRGSRTIPLLMNEYRFDHIFFTGSNSIGREVAAAAIRKNIPFTLESGGKNPAIVDKNVNLKVAARRILWSKFFNSGQSCVAPDYLLIDEDIKEEFLCLVSEIIDDFFDGTPLNSNFLTHIVNDSRMDVLISYLDQGDVVFGGSYDREKRVIEPTIIDNVDLDSPMMKKEIFGPILPVITYKTKNQALDIISKNPFPLATYIYTSDKKMEDFFITRVQSGGVCINNAIIHFVNPHIPFGGIGSSGSGHYHGEYSYRTFSYYKSITKTGTFFDLPVKFAPYTKASLKFIRHFFE